MERCDIFPVTSLFNYLDMVTSLFNYLDMVNNQMISIETLVLGIALSVLQHMEQELGGLEGPASLAGAVNSSLSVSTDSTHEPGQG